MTGWNGFDFIIFLIFLFNTLLGMARGATKEIISMLCLSAALIFAIKFTVPLSVFINSSPLITDVIASPFTHNFMMTIGLGPLTQTMLFNVGYCISLLICFAGVFCFCEAVLAYTGVIGVFNFPFLMLDRKIGAALGCARGYIFALIVIFFYLFLSATPPNSYFVNLFSFSASKFYYLINQQAPEKYQEILRDKNLYDERNVFQVVNIPKEASFYNQISKS